MSSGQHTPGPWYPVWNGHFWAVQVQQDAYSITVASAFPVEETPVGGSAGANVHVLAAAPEMFKELVEIHEALLLNSLRAADRKQYADRIGALIEKVKGGAT